MGGQQTNKLKPKPSSPVFLFSGEGAAELLAARIRR